MSRYPQVRPPPKQKFLTEINALGQGDLMAIILVKMDVSGLAGRKLTAVLVAFDRRISMIDRYVVGHRIVPAVHFSTYGAHETVLHALDVLLVPTPAYRALGFLLFGNLLFVKIKISA